MAGYETVGDDRFEAMEEEEIFAEALRSAEWIERAPKGRDYVSREIVKEMSSDAVSKSLAYLREKARALSARAETLSLSTTVRLRRQFPRGSPRLAMRCSGG